MLVKPWSLGRAFAWGTAIGIALRLATHPPAWNRLTDQMVAETALSSVGSGIGVGIIFVIVAAVRNRVNRA